VAVEPRDGVFLPVSGMMDTLAARRVSAPDLPALLGHELYSETIQYFVAKTGLSAAYVEQQLIECLRYLYLISTYPEQLSGLFLPVEQPIDEIWHYLILQTREYRQLCETRLPGRFFIEHRSLVYGDYQQAAVSREQLIEQALRWLLLYRDIFGPFDAQALPHWTMARFLHEDMGLSLAELAELGGAELLP